MFELKLLSKSAIPPALAQAERYRLLNEPTEAESICLDVLRIDPENQEALVTLVLAYTDQFPDESPTRPHSRRGAGRPADPRRVQTALLLRHHQERRGKAELQIDRPGSRRAVQDWLRDAMSCYERAEAIRPAGNDEAILRWNTCARILMDLPVSEPDVPGVPRRSVRIAGRQGVTEHES